jgi:transposase-like protein
MKSLVMTQSTRDFLQNNSTDQYNFRSTIIGMKTMIKMIETMEGKSCQEWQEIIEWSENPTTPKRLCIDCFNLIENLRTYIPRTRIVRTNLETGAIEDDEEQEEEIDETYINSHYECPNCESNMNIQTLNEWMTIKQIIRTCEISETENIITTGDYNSFVLTAKQEASNPASELWRQGRNRRNQNFRGGEDIGNVPDNALSPLYRFGNNQNIPGIFCPYCKAEIVLDRVYDPNVCNEQSYEIECKCPKCKKKIDLNKELKKYANIDLSKEYKRSGRMELESITTRRNNQSTNSPYRIPRPRSFTDEIINELLDEDD